MGLTQNTVDQRVSRFRSDLDRARNLYDTFVERGYVVSDPSDELASPLRQPDRRDAAQFIFFEAAAKFETFMVDMFCFEVRLRLCVPPKRARFIMGSSDRGLKGVYGWGSPKTVRKRARNLFGAVGFFARLDEHLGNDVYSQLVTAHVLRNRVAHDGGTTKYKRALGTLRVPKRSRRGAGVGRVLVDYPSTAAADDRWFHRFLDSYERFCDEAQSKLDV